MPRVHTQDAAEPAPPMEHPDEDYMDEPATEDSAGEEVDLINDDIIGEETMMKSMDMTIVSPSSLYSKVGLKSSQGSQPANRDSAANSQPSHLTSVRSPQEAQRSSPIDLGRSHRPDAQRSSPIQNQGNLAGQIDTTSPARRNIPSVTSSSPHVRFSSPLVTGAHDSSPLQNSELAESMSRESLLSRVSNSPANPSLLSSSPARHSSPPVPHLATLDSEEVLEPHESHDHRMTSAHTPFVEDGQSDDEESGSDSDPSPIVDNGDLSAILRQRVSNMMDTVDFSIGAHLEAPAGSPPRRRPVISPHLKYSPKRSSPLKHRLQSYDEDEELSERIHSTPVDEGRRRRRRKRVRTEEHVRTEDPEAAEKRERDARKRARKLARRDEPRTFLTKFKQRRRIERRLEAAAARAAAHAGEPTTAAEAPYAGASTNAGEPAVTVEPDAAAERADAHGPAPPDPTPADPTPAGEPASAATEGTHGAQPRNAGDGAPGYFLRLWQSVSQVRGEAPPPGPRQWPPRRPSHPLLANFRLLPRTHPWAEDHFAALLSLYKHWQRHAGAYAPELPHNRALLTPAWREYVDLEFANWGYELQLVRSLVVVAALFQQLLALDDAADYERLYGERLRMGFVAGRTAADGPIGRWHVALRLFTTIVGDVVRAEEAQGREIDRTPDLRWRFRGQWLWRRGWYGGLL
jgi:hypothetical protein